MPPLLETSVQVMHCSYFLGAPSQFPCLALSGSRLESLAAGSAVNWTELNQMKQQSDDEKAKAKLFQDGVQEKLRKADTLNDTLQSAWKQLNAARMALTETQMAAAQSKKENKQLRQDISMEKERISSLREEMRILVEQRKSETELCLSLKEQLRNFRQLQQAAGAIDSDNARMRDELSRAQEEICSLRMVAREFDSCKAELENLKQINTELVFRINSQQTKMEELQGKQREEKAESARLGIELKNEKQKGEEMMAANELARLRCEVAKEKKTVEQLQEREIDLLQQVSATTQQVEEERAAQKRHREELHHLAKRSEEQNSRLQQQMDKEELLRRRHQKDMHCLSHRLAELELKLAQLGADCQQLGSSLRSCQEELRLKEQTNRDMTTTENTLRSRLLQTQEELSASQEQIKVLERDKAVLLKYEGECERQAELILKLRSHQSQSEEEISFLKEEIQQQQLQHQDEVGALRNRLSEHVTREKDLADEADRHHRKLDALQFQLDEVGNMLPTSASVDFEKWLFF
ncbi:hypothetical protein BESB_017340 [Besnoitia besnoiti]|uniref:G protein gamma domain-containing protein n=1 Tax=Besnoitia besnoiti TaxID=94643 RepID=A0A2A9M939_BESBE|nr:hypothetical protein BESB_017340 [Besnoitia besnoiti]PFH32416.1 hypothetical protein BESB_017340 [Besnoitia besnoiti]